MTITFLLATPQDLLHKARHERSSLQDALYSQNKTLIAYALFNFAVTAYHVKDWLIRSATPSYVKQDVEDHVNANRALRICRDICNASKHQTTWRKDDVSGVTTSSTGAFTVSPLPSLGDVTLETEVEPGFRVKVVIPGGMRIEIIDLANQVIAAWEMFCKDHGLDT